MHGKRIRPIGKAKLFIEELERPALAQWQATTLAVGEECGSGGAEDKKECITTLAVGEEA